MRYDPSDEIFLNFLLKKTMVDDLPDLVDFESLSDKEKNMLLKEVQHSVPELYTTLMVRKTLKTQEETLKVEQERLEVDKQILKTQQEILANIKARNQKAPEKEIEEDSDENARVLGA